MTRLRASLLFLACTALLSCGDDVPIEMTGTVYDAATKKPLEGVFVLAAYSEGRGDFVRSVMVCVKSASVVTGKDGRFSFPVTRKGKLHLGPPGAVAEGFYTKDDTLPAPEVWKKQEAAAYADRDIYLARQDPDNPSNDIGFSGTVCTHTEFKSDGAAYAEYERRVNGERRRYFPDRSKPR